MMVENTQGRVRPNSLKNNSAKKLITELLHSAGITLNGNKTYDIQVHNEDFYQRVLQQGSLGAGEAYMDGWWDCERLDELFDRIIRANLEYKIKKSKKLLFHLFISKYFNLQKPNHAKDVAIKHYDLGNELFQRMLDTRLNYTCGYWKTVSTLDEAQLHKLKLSCEKLQLQPGMKLLDIGCGFGAFAKFAAENYGAEVTGISISEQQVKFAQKNCRGLPIEIRLQDYRALDEKFDRIVSLGMFEHVGYQNYRTYMEVIHRCLKADGLFLLHTIGSNTSVAAADLWITKYIFSHGMVPSIAQIGKAVENLFIMEDWHNFGADYDKTLLAWYENFSRNWSHLKTLYDDRFYRMWKYYLLQCAGAFRARSMQLWQIVFSKEGVLNGYQAPR